MTVDILCLGEPLIEFNQQPDGSYKLGYGGDTSNCAVAAARQGAKVGFVTHIGADAFGNSFLELWRDEGIDTSTVQQVTCGHTGVYFVTHGPDGHEFSYLRAGSAASQMTVDDLPVQALETTRILHVSGISQAISSTAADAVFSAMSIVKKAGGKISFDPNLRLKLWPIDRARAMIHAAAAQADILLPGLDDAQQLSGLVQPEDIAGFYLDLGAEVVGLTMGSEGTLVATADAIQKIEAHRVEAVDATGAGDTFDGAFLARIAAGDDPITAAHYANAAAALSTQNYGAVTSMPESERVTAFLAKGSLPDGGD